MFSNTSLSSAVVAKSVSLCCVIVVHILDFNSFNFEKLLSADAKVIGMVNRTMYAIPAVGKQSCHFKKFRISNHVTLKTLEFQLAPYHPLEWNL